MRCPVTNAPASVVKVKVLMPVPTVTEDVEVIPE
jgi:hypothetical protein